MTTTVLICSDTHASPLYIQQLIQKIDQHQPNIVIHLGDYWDDADHLKSASYDLIRVPGTWTHYYQNSDIDNRKFEHIQNWCFFLTHTPHTHFNDLPSDLNPAQVIAQQRCDIICHGHTHIPKITQENGVWILNPGHLKEGDDRGYPPSYAICKLNDSIIDCSICELLTDNVLISQILTKRL